MTRSSTHLPSLLGALLFILGAVFTLGISIVLVVITLGKILTGGQVEVRETITAAIFGFEGLLLLAAAFISIQKVMQKPSADHESAFTISLWQIVACLVSAGSAILIGSQILNNEPFNWLLLPLLTLIAVLLPILVLFGLGSRGILLGPRWRTWNILGISMTLVPVLTLIVEAMAILMLVLVAAIYLASQPDLIAQIEKLSGQIYLLQRNPQALLELISPLMLRPGVAVIALLFFSVLIPMMEELLKPLGVWLFSARINSPAQGFALGALCGATFAMIETLGVSPQTEDWSGILLTRLGTDILHITTAALMGAGIIYAVRERHYLRLVLIYMVCIFLHGLWNGLSIVFTFSTLADLNGKQNLFGGFSVPASIGLATLAVLLLLILIITNWRMRTTQLEPTVEEPTP